MVKMLATCLGQSHSSPRGATVSSPRYKSLQGDGPARFDTDLYGVGREVAAWQRALTAFDAWSRP